MEPVPATEASGGNASITRSGTATRDHRYV